MADTIIHNPIDTAPGDAKPEAKPATESSQSSLSASVFSDPKEVLRIIQSDFSRIDFDNSGGLSLGEIASFSAVASGQDKEAAKIAENHFDFLDKLGKDLPKYAMQDYWDMMVPPTGITRKELQLATDVANNNPQPYVDKNQSNLYIAGTMDVGLAAWFAGLTAVEVSTGVFAPLAVATGAIAAYWGINSYLECTKGGHDAEQIRNAFESDRAFLPGLTQSENTEARDMAPVAGDMSAKM